MLIVREIHNGGTRTEIGRAETLQEALYLIPSAYIDLEEDADHPGHWDLMNMRGQQFTIEPEGK